MPITDDFERSIRQFGEKVHAVGDDQWTNETPCSDWDVRALVNHLVNEASWVRPLLDGATIADVGDRFDGDLLGDDPVDAFDRAAADAIQSASGEGAITRIVHISSGPTPAGEYLAQVFTDFVIHGWDLARGIGADDTIEPAYAKAILEEMQPLEGEMKTWGVYGPKVDVPDDADTQTKLLAVFGRVQ